MNLSFIVITYNRLKDIRNFLPKLKTHVREGDELVILDNSSSDGTQIYLQENFAEHALILSDKNLGVAAGRNYAAKEAKNNICVFIDDDAEFRTNDFRDELNDLFKDEQLAAVAFTVLEGATSKVQRSSIPRVFKFRKTGSYKCSYFCGAGFALRKDLFIQLGGFWEGIFYAGEELDYGYRAVKAGYHFYRTDKIRVSHFPSNLRPKGQAFYHYARNRPLVAARNLSFFFTLTTCLFWWPKLLVGSIFSGDTREFLKGVKDFFKEYKTLKKSKKFVLSDIKRLIFLKGRFIY